MPRRRLLALADNRLHLLAYRGQADPQRLQSPGRHALALMDQTQQEMLSADVIVVQHPGFFLRQNHDPTCPVGKPLEHAPRRPSPYPGYDARQYDTSRLQRSAELRSGNRRDLPRPSPDDETILIVGTFTYAGTGWKTSGDALLANTAADQARKRRQAGRDQLADEFVSDAAGCQAA